MRVIIAGSRHITDPTLVDRAVAESGFNVTVVLCGEARGVDSLGRAWATARNIPVESYPADWSQFGHAAGPRRNRQMAANADALILVWDGSSRGSGNMLREARTHGLAIHECRC